ncbi:alkaline phosphatase family protein [Paenibacillus dokdonensis]|uniref:alkaline phosphatase family protein n=1 Tax=Paenibacillus dokdonensis TaxID=2567944 RepID=UPI0010A82E6B
MESYLDDNRDVKLLYMQLDEPDGTGHRSGYGINSPDYLQAITKSDQLVGRVLTKMEPLGLDEDSLIIILTDHGGGGADSHSQGSGHPEDMTAFCLGLCRSWHQAGHTSF